MDAVASPPPVGENRPSSSTKLQENGHAPEIPPTAAAGPAVPIPGVISTLDELDKAFIVCSDIIDKPPDEYRCDFATIEPYPTFSLRSEAGW